MVTKGNARGAPAPPVTAVRLVVDINVVVSGLITGDLQSPTAQVLDGMLAARPP